jgi:hypothetical protein
MKEIRLPKLYDYQAKVLDSPALVNMAMGGRRSGKTVVSDEVLLYALSGQTVALMLPNYPISVKRRDEIFQSLRDVIVSVDLAAKRAKFIGGGELQVFSGDALDNVRGHSFDHFVFDESGTFNNLQDAIKAAFPTLADKKGKLWMFGSYITNSYFANLWERVDEFPAARHFFDVANNPAIDKDYLEQMKRFLPLEDFMEEFYAIPKRNNQYNFFNWHGAQATTKPESNKMLYLSFDFNVLKINCVIGYRIKNEIHIVDHFIGRDLIHACQLALDRWEQIRLGQFFVCGDSAGKARSAIDTMSSYMVIKKLLNLRESQFKISSRNPLHVESRNFCNAVFRVLDVKVDPKLNLLVKDMHSLRYDPNTDEIIKDGSDHSCDSLRYLLHAIALPAEVLTPIKINVEPKPRDYGLNPLQSKAFWVRNELGVVVGYKTLHNESQRINKAETLKP